MVTLPALEGVDHKYVDQRPDLVRDRLRGFLKI
jgi:hypothetical protein